MSMLLSFLAGVLLLPALHVANVAGGLWIRRRLRRRLLAQARGCLVLTFDDGPGERLQSRLLQVLAEHGAPATFYLLGLRAEGREARARELLQHGHELGSHAFAHLDSLFTAPWTIHTDLAHAARAFRTLGVEPTSFRPPHGRLPWSGFLRVRAAGLPVVMWTHNSGDTYGSRPPLQQVVDAVARDGGGVVLMHSHDRSRDLAGEDYVVELTAALLQMARARGLRVVTAAGLMRGAAAG